MNLKQLLENTNELFIKQIKEWGEILLNIETVNKFHVLDKSGNKLAFLAEQGGGIGRFLTRNLFRSHRPLTISLYNDTSETILEINRPFYFFFSDLTVKDGNGQLLGRVQRRFGIVFKKFDLLDERGRVFAQVSAPLWSLWKFPIKNMTGDEIGLVSKKWGGILKEVFTDSDLFGVQFPNVSWEKKAVVFGLAVAIDLDFFEDNHDG